MTTYKLKPRPNAERISPRLRLSVQRKFNSIINVLLKSEQKIGFGKSEYMDEWFDWSLWDIDYWSMANHLFLVDLD